MVQTADLTGSVTFATLRPDPAFAPVAILTQGEGLIVFHLVLAEQLRAEVLLHERIVDHVDINAERQEFTVFYPESEFSYSRAARRSYSWMSELQTFTVSRVELPSQIAEITAIERTLFDDTRPKDVLLPLQTLLNKCLFTVFPPFIL